MKKRAKIIAIVSTLCLCLSLFVVGVLSVSTTSLSVTSSLSFKSNGAYVMVDGQLRQGATGESATLQSGAPATYTYKGYSYNCIGGTGADKDKPDGTASLESFVDASGASNATWAVGQISFSETLPVAVYHFTFTNYSAMMVFVSVSSNIQELNTDLAGKVSITESFESGNTIDAYDGTTAKTIVYTITVEITDYTTSFEDKQLDLTINFSTDLPDQSDYFTYNTAGTQITGLSDKYFEDNPSVLIVPGKTESGQNLTIASGSSSSPTFNGLVSPTVILQEGLTSVPQYAFSGCSSLSSITIPDSVTSIGSYAFDGCSSLSSINIPDGVTSIGQGTFDGCSSLSSITIPESVTIIEEETFKDCSSLSSIILPEGVTSIGHFAFLSCRSLSSINIPSTVTSIGNSAFNGCYALVEVYNYSTHITVNKGVTNNGYLGQYALYVYNANDGTEPEPTKISVDGNVQYYTDGTDRIAIGTYGNRNAINEITFKDGTTKINKYAFYECYALTSVTLPSSVKSIGEWGFNGCSALAEVYNYSSLNITAGSTSNGYVGYYAKVVHTSNEETKIIKEDGMQYYPNDDETYIALSPIDRSSIKEVNIKAGTTEINQFAFSYCSSLSSISLPNSVKSIGSYAFSYCSSLSSISLPNSVKSIGSYAFDGCSSLSSINIPEGVTSIGSYAFQNCSSLSSISLPESVTSIGSSAFRACSSLSSINIPEGVTSIGNQAFFGCSSLTSIDMTNVVDWNNLTLRSSSFNTNASTSAPTVITISSNADIPTVISKLTSSVIGSSMTNKIKFTNGTTTYVWNGTAWAEQTA